jgi:Putative metallopeptidase
LAAAALAGALALIQAPAVPPASAWEFPHRSEIFQAGIDEAVRELAKEPRLRHLSAAQRQARVEFVFGNMLFVTIHELGHALISEMELTVLGPEEDAADTYAILGVLKHADDFSRRVLTQAATGWFLTAQRDRKAGETPHYYERHGLNEQRAYRIVCLMVGSDPVKFKALADEMQLPEDRRRTCQWDYDTASRSWDKALVAYRRAAHQDRTQIAVRYGKGDGPLALPARIFSATRFLETVVQQVADRYLWPAPITVEMRSCDEANARWIIPTRRLELCYELAREFGELYRDYGASRTRFVRHRPGSRTKRQLRSTSVRAVFGSVPNPTSRAIDNEENARLDRASSKQGD